jgi:hypothetical protein
MRPLQLSASSRAKMYRCYRLRLHSDMLFRGTEPLSRPESSQPVREGPRNRLRYSSGPIQSCAGSLFSVSPCLRGESFCLFPICAYLRNLRRKDFCLSISPIFGNSGNFGNLSPITRSSSSTPTLPPDTPASCASSTQSSRTP